MSVAIKVENLSKLYELGDFGTGTISRDLERFWTRMQGKEDPFSKIGETNDRSKRGNSNMVWSLRDLNFQVEKGAVVGIIGRNGAGKSTLLKILSRVTSPTTGSVKIKGRIASMLEVGTGFHPELTGRENIFLNGTILGMRKSEIKNKFDQIVDFSGVERYIDTPVKRYSSGMYVRLAFAVAAHLESEVLIVDEVLAVGDADFQKKCLGKIGEVSKGEGRTVLIVSHNMGSIQQLCSDCLLLKNGELVYAGNKEEAIEKYLALGSNNYYQNLTAEGDLILSEAYLDSTIQSEEIIINIMLKSKVTCYASFDIRVYSNTAVPVGFGSIGSLNYTQQLSVKPGDNSFQIGMDVSRLALGNYSLSFDITNPNVKYYDRCENCLSVEIVKLDENDRRLAQYWGYGSALIPLRKL
jgi:lipopolysaccharide transport system ATP-binding protein